ncbi:hypothetical protein Bca101_088249 [Brassica carinata]
MVKGTITTMVTRLFPWSFDCATAQELDNSINVFRARETETWRICVHGKRLCDTF